MKRTLVIADIHGAYLALIQVLERAQVTENDTLIFLGDYVDGWLSTYYVVEKLLELEKTNECVFLRGNHDEEFFNGLNGNGYSLLGQGCKETIASYVNKLKEGGGFVRKDILQNFDLNDIPHSHYRFYKNLLSYYKDEQNNIFVHAGFNRHFKLDEQNLDYIYWWDRDLFMAALSYNEIKNDKGKPRYKFKIAEECNEIFIGHTQTGLWKRTTPMHTANIWNIDTGCGFGAGKLTIMDVESKEYWQSDPANSLYPDEKGRR